MLCYCVQVIALSKPGLLGEKKAIMRKSPTGLDLKSNPKNNYNCQVLLALILSNKYSANHKSYNHILVPLEWRCITSRLGSSKNLDTLPAFGFSQAFQRLDDLVGCTLLRG